MHPRGPEKTPEDHDKAMLSTQLEREAELHSPALEQAADWLHTLLEPAGATTSAPSSGSAGSAPVADSPPGRELVNRILDIGSGPGATSCLLARRFPGAEVVAVDQDAKLLEDTRARAAGQGLHSRISTQQVRLPRDFPALGRAELIWAGNTVHHLGDQQGALSALAACLRPGGVLAVAERGLTPRFLPRDIGLGRPGLQARLDTAAEDAFQAMRAALPDATRAIEDWPAMLAGAGLVPTGTRTFLIDHPAPLSMAAHEYLHTWLVHRRAQVGGLLDEEDRATLDRLVDGDACTGIIWRPDAFYRTAITVHTARACAPRPPARR
ncbi:class I SAM-dependent methyltransferase [Streptomyces axinellae]|uniref:Class I SAM-dependent methyltransferase n=1 Tax=Streptomyces axinellae TaxID=552788 RepID=A0ABP6CHA2_9ACTN